jgi:hypothetical protein
MKLKDSALLVAGYYTDAIRVLHSLKTGVDTKRQLKVVGGDGCALISRVPYDPSYKNSYFLSHDVTPCSPIPRLAKKPSPDPWDTFDKSYQDWYGEEPTEFAAMGYNAASAWYFAFNNGGNKSGFVSAVRRQAEHVGTAGKKERRFRCWSVKHGEGGFSFESYLPHKE